MTTENRQSVAPLHPIVTTRGIGGHTSPNRGATDSWITPKHIIAALGPFDSLTSPSETTCYAIFDFVLM